MFSSLIKLSKIKKIIVPTLIVAGLFLSGCVSQKEHSQTLKRLKYLENQNSSLAKNNAQLRSVKEMISVELNQDLAAEYEEMSQKAERASNRLDRVYRKLEKYQISRSELMDSLSVKLALFLPEQLELESENGNLHVSFTNMIFFASNKSRLSMSGKSTLADLAFVLKNQESEFDIQVIGHADPRKINSEKHEDNWALSMKRALAVVRELEKHHVNSARITASAKSYFDPYHNGKYDLGMKADRRVEIVFIPKFEHEVYNILFGLK